MTPPALILHVVPPSHPCRAAEAALRHKGLAYEKIDLVPGPHVDEMQRIYGEGNSTVPGLLVDGVPVHGSRAIFARLEELVPDPTLYPSAVGDAVRDAERWGEEELQDLGRRLPWAAMHFRPEALGTFNEGGRPLDGPGTDFAMKFVRSSWKYHGITASRLHDDLASLPAKLDHIDSLAEQGLIGGEQATGADLQIASTLRVLMTVGDLAPLLEDRAAELALRWFPEYPGHIPAGAYPAGWVPPRHA